jgi:hypothetical protein
VEAFALFKFLHIVSMFFFVAAAFSGEIVMRRIAATGDVRAIRTALVPIKFINGPVAIVLLLAGLIFGFVAALAGQMNLLAPWLLLAYGTVVLAMVIGIGVTDPWVGRLDKAAAASTDETASGELAAIIGEPLPGYGSWAQMALIAILVFIMVVKPLS